MLPDNNNQYTVGNLTVVSLPTRPPVMSRRRRQNQPADPMEAAVEQDVQSDTVNENRPRRTKEEDDKSLVYNFTYNDHTADIQIHGWGGSLETAFESVGVGMFSYMFERYSVFNDPECTDSLSVQAPDIEKLCFVFLDELLSKFTLERIVIRDIKVHSISYIPSQPTDSRWNILFTIQGEKFCADHKAGTEIKAITYSNLVIKTRDTTRFQNTNAHTQLTCTEPAEHEADIFVIVDI